MKVQTLSSWTGQFQHFVSDGQVIMGSICHQNFILSLSEATFMTVNNLVKQVSHFY